MEGNGIIEVKGRMLCFGMKAAEYFGENLNTIEDQYGKASQWDIFVCMLHAGLMNEDYNERRPLTSFKDASLFADEIEKTLQEDIWKCYEESKPGQAINKGLLELIGSVQKKSAKENPNVPIGQQLESTPPKTESDTGNLPA